MKVQLAKVKPNPFRNIDAYPIDRRKVDQLKKSIQSTDFWDNIVARKSGDGIEIAYGHHRLHALKELHPGTKEFDFIVRDLDDAMMIKIMADENMDEWNHDSAIERETVRAIVQAAAEGKIGLPRPPKDVPSDKLRYAPSFCYGINGLAQRSPSSGERPTPYTADSIVGFLGGTMSVNTVKYTLQALCLIEQGHLKEEQLAGLTGSQSRTIIEETSRAIKQAEVIKKTAEREALSAATPVLEKKIKQEAEKKATAVIKTTAKAVSGAMQSGSSATEAKQKAMEARISIQPEVKELPEINEAAARVASQIMRLLDPEYDPGKKLTDIIKFREHLSPTSMQNLQRALGIVVEYAEGYRARLS